MIETVCGDSHKHGTYGAWLCNKLRLRTHIAKPMPGFKSFAAARSILAGIELMHMIRQGPMRTKQGKQWPFADQLYPPLTRSILHKYFSIHFFVPTTTKVIAQKIKGSSLFRHQSNLHDFSR